jgi:acyl transferase domain-containing protein
MADDEIVISGMAGRFPNAANTAELAHNLYNKVSCIRIRKKTCDFKY